MKFKVVAWCSGFVYRKQIVKRLIVATKKFCTTIILHRIQQYLILETLMAAKHLLYGLSLSPEINFIA